MFTNEAQVDVSMETVCRILRDTKILLHGMELAWAVATIVFRFILVRFADRGLVNGGVVSKLFGYLYICFGGCFSLLTYSMILASHTKQIEMTNLCLLNYSNEYHMSWNKNLKIGTAFTTVGLILLWMLYLRCKFFRFNPVCHSN